MARLLDDLLDVSRLSRGRLLLQRAPVSLADVLARRGGDQPAVDRRATAAACRSTPATRAWWSMATASAWRRSSPTCCTTPRSSAARAGGSACRRGARATRRWCGSPTAASASRRSCCRACSSSSCRVPTERGGLGIGLSLAKRLVEMHGGAITRAQRGPRQGQRVHRAPATDVSRGHAAITTPPSQAPVAAARKVLIVDDNADVAEITSLLLKGAGCDVRVAYDGATALDDRRDLSTGNGLHGSRHAGAGRVRSLPPDSRVLVGNVGADDRRQRLGAGRRINNGAPPRASTCTSSSRSILAP